MILSICINPSVIRTIVIDGGLQGTSEAISDNLSISDSGIYSAYIIKIMQGEPLVIGFSGGIGGRFVKNFLDTNKIKSDLIRNHRETGTTLCICDKQGKKLSTILSHKQEYSKHDKVNIKHKIFNHLRDIDLVVYHGDQKSYEIVADEIVHMTKEPKKLIVSMEGEAICQIFDHRIFGIVLDEKDKNYIQEVMGKANILSETKYAQGTKEWMEEYREFFTKKKIHIGCIITNQYIYGFTKNKICRVIVKERSDNQSLIKSTILGGIAIGTKRKYTLEKTMKLIGAIANEVNPKNYPFVLRRKEIDRNSKHTSLEEMYNHRNGYIQQEN